MRLKVRWLNSALIASKPSAIAMIGATSPTMSMNENGIGSGAIVSRRRNRNGLSPIVSRIAVVENQASDDRDQKNQRLDDHHPGAAQLVRRLLGEDDPVPVKGEPLRRMPDLVEIAGIDLVEARLGETDADQLDMTEQAAGRFRRADRVRNRPGRVPAPSACTRTTPGIAARRSRDPGAARLDIDDMAAAEHCAAPVRSRCPTARSGRD